MGSRPSKSAYTLLGPGSGSRVRVSTIIGLVVGLLIVFGLTGLFVAPRLLHPSRWLPDDSSVWDYLSLAGSKGHLTIHRPSWGALSSQGAKASFRTNLRPDKRYVSSFILGGWNNQVICAFNLLYLAVLSERVPIVPAFTANVFHTGSGAGGIVHDVAVGEIFDLNYLSAVLNDLPIVEMHELKGTNLEPARLKEVVYDGEFPQMAKDEDRNLEIGEHIPPEAPEWEDIGCWSFWGGLGKQEGVYGGADINPIRTPLPPHIWRNNLGNQFDFFVPSIIRLSQFIWPGRLDTMPPGTKELIANYSLPEPAIPPEDHVSFIDSLYYFVEQESRWDLHREWTNGQGTWNRIGKHMKWTAGIEEIRDMYLRKLFDIPYGEIPPYMAVHIRRTDFSDNWKVLTPRDYAHAASEVMYSVRDHLGIALKHILVTTDETDPDWIAGLHDFGIKYINHTESQTVERFGHWLPTILDSAILSKGKGFLGVASSTMSICAYRRVIDWEGGVARMIASSSRAPEDWVWSLPE